MGSGSPTRPWEVAQDLERGWRPSETHLDSGTSIAQNGGLHMDLAGRLGHEERGNTV